MAMVHNRRMPPDTADLTAPSAAAGGAAFSVPDLTTDCVLMRLRPAAPARAWYEGGVLYQTVARHTELDDDVVLDGVLNHAARLGGDGILLDGVLPDARRPQAARTYAELARRARLLGLRVIASVDRPSSTVRGSALEELLAATAAVTASGVDGVDLGLLTSEDRRSDVLREFLREVRRRYGTDLAVSASTRDTALDSVLDGFDPDAQPLLRHDHLSRAGWNAHALRTAVAAAVRRSDARGAPLVWSVFAADERAARTGMAQLETEEGRRIMRAGVLAALALPGTLVLRQGEEVSTLAPRADHLQRDVAAQVVFAVAEQRGVPGSPFESYRRALSIRRDEQLGTGALSWVDVPGVAPATTLVFLNRGILCVMNFGPALTVDGPPTPVVHSSAPISQDGARLVIPRDTTVWLRLA